MRKVISLLATLSLLIGVAGITAPAALAACSNAKLVAYEDPNYVVEGGTLAETFCYPTNVNDLRTRAELFGDGCSSLFVSFNHWDNCMSSWKFTTAGMSGGCYHYGINLWRDYNGTGTLVWSRWGPGNFAGGLGFEDMISSITFKYRSQCPLSGGV